MAITREPSWVAKVCRLYDFMLRDWRLLMPAWVGMDDTLSAATTITVVSGCWRVRLTTVVASPSRTQASISSQSRGREASAEEQSSR